MRIAAGFVSVVILTAFAIASPLSAVTYVIPEDRDLVLQARAIVAATGQSSYSQLAADGRIVTICELRVDDVLKGDLAAGGLLRLTELGGVVGDRMFGVPGAPRYAAGARYIVFVGDNGMGELSTFGMGMGRFVIQTDATGREIAERLDSDADAIAVAGNTVRGALRDAPRFAEYIRATARGENAKPEYFVDPRHFSALSYRATTLAKRSDYLMTADLATGMMARWQTPTATFFTRGTQPVFLNGGIAAATNATGAWSTGGGSVSYSVGGTTTASGGLTRTDGVNSIQFNDPNGFVAARCPSGCVAIGGFWALGTHTIDGETFYSIVEVDVEMGSSLSSVPEAIYQGVLTHEIGHTLGFRHSNLTADNSSACASPSPCAAIGAAIMASTYLSSMTPTLKQWDKDAVTTVYPPVKLSRRRAVGK